MMSLIRSISNISIEFFVLILFIKNEQQVIMISVTFRGLEFVFILLPLPEEVLLMEALQYHKCSSVKGYTLCFFCYFQTGSAPSIPVIFLHGDAKRDFCITQWVILKMIALYLSIYLSPSKLQMDKLVQWLQSRCRRYGDLWQPRCKRKDIKTCFSYKYETQPLKLVEGCT